MTSIMNLRSSFEYSSSSSKLSFLRSYGLLMLSNFMGSPSPSHDPPDLEDLEPALRKRRGSYELSHTIALTFLALFLDRQFSPNSAHSLYRHLKYRRRAERLDQRS